MYNLLIGKSPFPHGDTKENYENIKRSRYKYPRDKVNQVSAEAKDLIHFILNPDPELRPTIDEILEHSFFTDPSDGVPLRVLPRSFPRTILNYPPSEDFIRSL
jgi:serine/threonine protein kinase